jgi:uncharacterized cupin superfamily protein
MTGRLVHFALDAITPIEGAPPPDRVVAGAPRFRTWAHYRSPDGMAEATLHAGQWEATPGTWRIAYTRWEFMRILSGRCIIRGDDGTVAELGAGDVFVIEPGFSGTWEVVETMRKDYVLR